MSLIKYCRCDDRLIHGQVIYKWVKYLNIKQIIVVDDETSQDVISKGLVRMAAPKDINLSVISVNEATRYFYKKEENDSTLVLIKGLSTVNRMLDLGISIDKLIIGRIPTGTGKKKLTNNVYINNNEYLLINTFINKNIDVEIQMIPDEKAIKIEDVLDDIKGVFF